jgi:hypothetical protein
MGFVPTLAHFRRAANLAFLADTVRTALLSGDHKAIRNARRYTWLAPAPDISDTGCQESWELLEAVAASLDRPVPASTEPRLPPLSGVRAQIDLLEHLTRPGLSEPHPPPREC